ncbi:MAG TPA: zinc metalloprotease HtpX [Armatimonadota bacterium]|nr:zinc metalloprotease HtpX [Armatimonadota bacterium]
MSLLKIGLLVTGLTALFVVVGHVIGGATGVVIALALALITNFASYWYSDRIILGMYGARPVPPKAAPELYGMLERLAQAAKIPVPRLYILPDPQPNAFATGRSPAHAAVALNQGLLDRLGPREIEGVLAHEIAHIKHRDTLTMTLVATLAGAVMTLVQLGYFASMFGGMARDDEEGGGGPVVALLMLLFAPLAATLIQLGISRTREYEADASAARLTGNPEGLARALLKLEQSAEQIPSHATPATAHLFIVNPLSGAGGMMLSLFQTHPPIQQRVERLLRQARQPAPAVVR